MTAAGVKLRPEIEDTLHRLEAARHVARVAHEQAAISLQFAATHALSLTFFPAWLSAIEAKLPVGRKMGPIQMVSDSFAACEDVMLQRRAQFLLCHAHPAVANRLDETQFVFAKVGEDRLLPVTAATALGAAMHSIISAAKSPLPVLAYGQASGIGQIMRSVMKTAFDDGKFTTVFTAHHAVLLKTMAMEGRGIAWLPESLIAADLKAKRLVLAGASEWWVPIEIRLFRPRAPLSEAAEALWIVVSSQRG